MSFVIPRYLDEPQRLLLMTMDEATVVLGAVIAGFMMGQFFPGLGCGLVGLYVLRRFKGSRSANVLRTQAYWLLPQGVTGLRASPPSHLREYVG